MSLAATYREMKTLEEASTYSGLDAFKKDESMIDDLENDLQMAGLKPNRDYKLDLRRGQIKIMKDKNPKLKNIVRIYRLKKV